MQTLVALAPGCHSFRRDLTTEGREMGGFAFTTTNNAYGVQRGGEGEYQELEDVFPGNALPSPTV